MKKIIFTFITLFTLTTMTAQDNALELSFNGAFSIKQNDTRGGAMFFQLDKEINPNFHVTAITGFYFDGSAKASDNFMGGLGMGGMVEISPNWEIGGFVAPIISSTSQSFVKNVGTTENPRLVSDQRKIMIFGALTEIRIQNNLNYLNIGLLQLDGKPQFQIGIGRILNK